ncbi:MAG: hypothetical protein JXB48_20520 [Candidatus Latescibacteria bacterium]|nr:hypothetical protein [Candidatus Latescibacterota bacterium]
MAKLTRRNMLKTGAVLTAGASGMGTGVRYVNAADRAGSRYNWGHTVDFGEQYYRNMKDIIEQIRLNEMDLIGDLTSRMAEAVKKGNNGWMQAQAGHMGYIEFKEEHKGNPGILRSGTVWNGSDYDQMKSGDVLMTNYVNEDVKAARDRGVYVIGVPVNYVDNEWAPRGFTSPNVNNWLLGDVSDVILQSYIPYHQGIVDCPEIPEMKLCPSAANSLNSLYWMFQAEVANKVKNKKAKHIDYSLQYIDTILERITKAYHQKNYMFDHAATVAKMIGNGGRYHVRSEHRGVESESNGVAMGPMMTNAFRKDKKKGDVHLFATIEPDDATIVKEAKEAKDMGMFVISIAPGNSLALRQTSDVFIDNLSPEGGGLFEIEGYDKKVSTAGGVMNNWLMWIFTAQFVDEMVRRGWIPWFWMGGYTVGGSEYNNAMRPFFFKQGF